MVNHIENLEDYVKSDEVYNRYLKEPNSEYNDFEWFCINHVEDIRWALNEIKQLNEMIRNNDNENKVI